MRGVQGVLDARQVSGIGQRTDRVTSPPDLPVTARRQ
jgi:hypothetical protein